MKVFILNEAGDLARYEFTDFDVDMVSFGSYPPVAGPPAALFGDDGSVEVHPFVPADPVPQIISDRQFFQQLAIDGVITQAEALATADGTMPALLTAIIGQMPAEARFGALMLVKNATTFERGHTLTAVVGQALGWDAARLDRLWQEASKL